MTKWLLRGLVFAALMVVVRLVQGALLNTWETKAALISIVLVVLFAIAAFVWGFFDGRADAAANPDPDRRADLAMTWLLGGLLAGVLSGLVSWLISLVYDSLYVGGLINEVTTFAAFTALVVFLAGIAGVAIGRWRTDRRADRSGRSLQTDEDRTDTDVFAAVRGDDEQTASVAARPYGAADEPTEEHPRRDENA
jgi:predicted lipid-binding transport protein (Tim44 family)